MTTNRNIPPRFKRLAYLIPFLFLLAPLGTFAATGSLQGLSPAQFAGIPAAKMKAAFSLLSPQAAVNTYRNGYVNVTHIYQGQGYFRKLYGQEIRMKRKDQRIKAKYFASGKVYDKYSAWKKNKDIVMVCAGAFSDYNLPTGLTVDNGTLVNRKLDESMDALVIVYATGGVVVSDLDNRELNITIDGKRKSLDLRDAFDLKVFLDWAEQENATVFQTQLLAFEGELKLEVEKAKTELASRRFLVLAQDQFGSVFHIVLNIEESVYLGPATQDVFGYVQGVRNMDVIGMINLDTGMYDIMEFYNDTGSKVSDMAGSEKINKATNLVAYYYE